jgi:hypothetical protein
MYVYVYLCLYVQDMLFHGLHTAGKFRFSVINQSEAQYRMTFLEKLYVAKVTVGFPTQSLQLSS